MNTSHTILRRHRRLPRHPGAFSLVEVTIAVAIAALGFVTLLGLLPQSITMARNSAEMSVGSRIIQKLNGDMQSIAWDRITWTGYGPLRFFTNEGREMTSADTTPEDMASSLAFVASVYVPQKPLDVVLPSGTSGGGSSSGTPETYVRRVRICVATSNDPSFNFNSASPMRITSSYSYIAKMAN
ncbi:Verru_Chthon cassette protein B [Prosthecobacter sp.]|uniref:Verru_Chthon cassette protein B n=1 Tax=Prosthecobacter sp. TaxID=1965333 RepID=UPI003783C88E